MKMICVTCYIAVLVSALGVIDATGHSTHSAPVVPVVSDAARSDAKQGFMRRVHKSTGEADPDEAAEKGPAGSKAPNVKTAENVVADAEKAKTDPKDTKDAKDANPIEQAADAVADTVSDVLKPLQQGPNADATKASDNQKDQAKDAPADAGSDSQQGPTFETKAPEEPEDKEVPSVPGCRNFPKGWADSRGDDCEDYAEGEWCNRRGSYGDGWLDEWGTFEKLAVKGSSATDVCCVCGGGYREEGVGAPASAPAEGPAAATSYKGPILGTKVGRALQGQGFTGELVEHEDQQTMTEDWGMEFGPSSGHREIKDICKEHPGNEWCSLHGYYDSEKKESAAPSQSMVSIIVAVVVASMW